MRRARHCRHSLIAIAHCSRPCHAQSAIAKEQPPDWAQTERICHVQRLIQLRGSQAESTTRPAAIAGHRELKLTSLREPTRPDSGQATDTDVTRQPLTNSSFHFLKLIECWTHTHTHTNEERTGHIWQLASNWDFLFAVCPKINFHFVSLMDLTCSASRSSALQLSCQQQDSRCQSTALPAEHCAFYSALSKCS